MVGGLKLPLTSGLAAVLALYILQLERQLNWKTVDEDTKDDDKNYSSALFFSRN